MSNVSTLDECLTLPTFDEYLTLPTPDECPTLEEIVYVLENRNTASRKGWTRSANTSTLTEARTLTSEQIWILAMENSLKTTSKLLNVSITALKLICRKRDIHFWPYRKYMSCAKLLESPEVLEQTKVRIRRILEQSSLHRFKFSEELEEELKKLKQRVYKSENKKKFPGSKVKKK